MYEVFLILHFLGLALGVGASFAMFTLSLAAEDLPERERSQFMLRAGAISKNGSIGLTLLILSGIGFLVTRGFGEVMRWGGGAFHTKLLLVVILAGLLGYSQVLAKKARQAGGGPPLARLRVVGRVMLSVSVAIIVLAVVAFK
jgi:uncharacterized membrane protein